MRKVLIVDDEASVRTILALTLRDSGHDVLEAGDGLEALRVVDARSPDLVLLDVDMPGISGFEVLRRLKANPATRDIPVIVLTALAQSPGYLEQGLSLGADEFLAKPIAMAELTVRVGAALRSCEAEREVQRLRSDFGYLLAQDCLNYLGAVQVSIAVVLEEEKQRIAGESRGLLERAVAAIQVKVSGTTGSHFVAADKARRRDTGSGRLGPRRLGAPDHRPRRGGR